MMNGASRRILDFDGLDALDRLCRDIERQGPDILYTHILLDSQTNKKSFRSAYREESDASISSDVKNKRFQEQLRSLNLCIDLHARGEVAA